MCAQPMLKKHLGYFFSLIAPTAFSKTNLGTKAPGLYTWTLSCTSNWAIAAGSFDGSVSVLLPGLPSSETLQFIQQ